MAKKAKKARSKARPKARVKTNSKVKRTRAKVKKVKRANKTKNTRKSTADRAVNEIRLHWMAAVLILAIVGLGTWYGLGYVGAVQAYENPCKAVGIADGVPVHDLEQMRSMEKVGFTCYLVDGQYNNVCCAK